jgi:hypothetical protein
VVDHICRSASTSVLFLLGFVPLSRGPSQVPDAEYWAARIALMALEVRATGFAPHAATGVQVNGGQAMTPEEAARVLADSPKPIRCESRILGSVLAVKCETIMSAQLLAVQLEDRRRAVQSWRQGLRDMGISASEAQLLIRSPIESIVVPFSAIEAFERDYRVYCALVLLRGGPAARPRGADAVIELRQSSGARTEP